jgi:FMN phosphatase YigB (HAD superfamily)
MKFFIDFDDVLFNTKNFKKDLIGIFLRNGVSEKQFVEESYWDGRYNLEEQIKSLGNKYQVDTDKLTKDTNNLLNDLSEYVFPDVKKFLKKIRKENLFLISYGDQEIQWRKIEQSGLISSFQEIVITSDKVKAVEDILKRHKGIKTEGLYFIDDRSKYLDKIKKELPKIITVLIRRAEGRYPDESDNMADIVLKNLDNFVL